MATTAVVGATGTLSLSVLLSHPYRLTRLAGEAGPVGPGGGGLWTTSLRAISGVVRAPDGALYIADPFYHQVRRVIGGNAERIGGSSQGLAGFVDQVAATASRFSSPSGLFLDSRSGALLVCDTGNRRVRLFRPGGIVSTFAGGGLVTSSPTTAASMYLDAPVALAGDRYGNLFVADRDGGRVWRLASDRTAHLVANMPGACALALDSERNLLWVGTSTGRVHRVTGARTAPVLDLATPVLERNGQRIQGLVTNQQGTLFALSATVAGDARLWRFPVDAQGRLEPGQTPIAIAGTGIAGAASADYVASTTPTLDALQAKISVPRPACLFLDLSHVGAAATPAGQLILGVGYEGAVGWAQVIQLDVTD
ncbi:MAG: hypothetical protein VKP62_06105 [Candidatus Sericytochromatia bacterium]|nr:hypothetical protein [Candidatus Sericytochromatia bacterium]